MKDTIITYSYNIWTFEYVHIINDMVSIMKLINLKKEINPLHIQSLKTSHKPLPSIREEEPLRVNTTLKKKYTTYCTCLSLLHPMMPRITL